MNCNTIMEIGLSLDYGTETLVFSEDKIKESCLKDVRERLNKSAKQLSKEEIEYVLGLLANIKNHYIMLINNFADMGFEVKKEVETINGEERESFTPVKSKEDKTLEQRLASLIIRSRNTSLYDSIILLKSAVEVIDIGIEEISKYLPSLNEPSEDERKLHRVTKNISE